MFLGLPILPRDLHFNPTERLWSDSLSADDPFAVVYSESRLNSRIVIGMRYENEDEVSGIFWPASVLFDVVLLSKDMAKKLGIERLQTSRIEIDIEKYKK